MPGNHDWYDGLNGFMYHACGAEALPEISYDTYGLTFRERIAQSLWRKPTPPERELLDPIRRRRGQIGHLGIPHLPGPYYAVDLGCSRADEHEHDTSCPALLRLVVVDNGITGSIDVEQAAWLERMVAPAYPLPKIVVTGIPIAVNNKFNWLRVADPQNDLVGPTDVVDREVLSILRDNPTVVATLAGDIHNYQRIDFTVSTEADSLLEQGVPPLQIVCGGAGAFLSAAHPVTLQDDHLVLEHAGHRKVSSAGARTTIRPQGHVRFPSREGSLAHYASRTRPYLGVVLILLALDVLGLVMATRKIMELRQPSTADHSQAWLLGGPWLILLGVVVVGAVLAWVLRSLRKAQLPPVASGVLPRSPGRLTWFSDWGRRLAVTLSVLTLVGLAAAVTRVVGPSGFLYAALGLAVIVALLVALFVPSLVQSFPRLGRSWVALVGLALVGYRVVTADPQLGGLLRLLGAAVVAGTVVVLAVLIHRKSTAWLTRRSFLWPWARRCLNVVRLLPSAAVAVVLLLAFEFFPTGLLEEAGFKRPDLPAQVGRFLYWSTLAALSTALIVAATLVPLAKANKAVPARAWLVIGGTALAVVASTCYLLTTLAQEAWRGWWFAVLVAAALVAPGCGVVIWLLPHLVKRPDPDPEELRGYLSRRDGGTRRTSRGRGSAAAAVIGAIPGLEATAEASTPPFAKNVVVVQHEHGDIHFRAYGINNESAPEAEEAPLGQEPPPDVDGPGPAQGFFLIDHVKVCPGTREVHVQQTWSALEHHIPPPERTSAPAGS